MRWTYVKVLNEAKKYKRRGDFARANRGAYGWAYKNDKLDTICSHMEKRITLDKVLTLVSTCKSRGEFRVNFPREYHWAKRSGNLHLIFSKLEWKIPNARITWDLDSVTKEAKKYYKKEVFRIYGSGAYLWAKKHNVLDQICSHMTRKKI